MPFEDIISHRPWRRGEADPIAGALSNERWAGFTQEALLHVQRLAADGRDGGLRQAGLTPDLFRLPQSG